MNCLQMISYGRVFWFRNVQMSVIAIVSIFILLPSKSIFLLNITERALVDEGAEVIERKDRG